MRSLRFSTSPVVLFRASAVLAGVAALSGCSSDSQRFQSLFTSVQPQYIQPVAPAQTAAAQPMPQGVDVTSTGSIAAAPQQSIFSRIPRPLAAIGQVFTPQAQPLQARAPLLPAPAMQAPLLPAPQMTAPVVSPVKVARTPLLQPVAAPVLPAPVLPNPVVPAPQLRSAAPALAPVAAPTLAPVAAPLPLPQTAQGVNPRLDTMATGAVAPAAARSTAGWTTERGTKVTMREGETVYNLSRRFGVPATEILRANGIEKAGSVQTGQTLIIPTYQYGANAPVSAPDAHPETAIAKGSRGTVFDIPSDRVPQPTPRPGDQVAVLPTVPQPKRQTLDPMSTGTVAAAPADAAANAAARALPVDQPLAQGDGRYKVASGDTLSAIARRHGVSVGQLRAANGLADNGVIKIGQKLNIPGVATASNGGDGVDGTTTGNRTVQSAKAPKLDSMPTAGIDPKQAKPKAPEAPATGQVAESGKALRWPVQGKVATAFRAPDNGKPNDGIDIDVPAGTPVKAAEGGTVIYSGSGLAEFGNTVLIRHDNGLVTVYGHADKLNVERNQRVSKGDVIALSGASGKTSKPKLHFEVRKNSVPVDPSQFLQ
jgi:murein DD-endopeptidase MepM/ murein hydrolase activator NlpD